MKTKDKIIRMEIQRRNNEIIFFLKIPKEIESFFEKSSSPNAEASQCWKDKDGNGLRFYRISPEIKARLDNLGLNSSGYLNDYGNGLMDVLNDNRINIAPLRTIGVSKGIWMHCENLDVRNIDFEYYIRELGSFTKELYENLIANKKIKAEIVFEI